MMYRKLWLIGLVCLMSLSLITLNADAQQKILGPYLWMVAKTAANQGGQNSTDIDSLDVASDGKVTEDRVAKNGAREGDKVGEYEWTAASLANDGNINTLVNTLDGFPRGDDNALNDITSYALVILKTNKAQKGVAMGVSSDDSVKVWLNGEVVHTNARNRGRGDANSFQDNLNVDLKNGNNLFMIKVSERGGGWGMHFGVGGDYDVSDVDGVFPVEPTGKITTQWAQIKNFK